jgi:4-carboxymuconolactone decarboxylase
LARVPYIDRDDLAESDRPIFDRIAIPSGEGGTDRRMPNSRRALLNSPRAAEAVGRLGDYVRTQSALDPVAREIAILSVARQTNSDYEWANHEPVASQVGVTDQVIESIRTGRAPMGIPAKDGIYAQAAKELVTQRTLSPRTFQAVEHLLGPRGTVDLVVLVGYYTLLSMALAALDVELDAGLESDLNA